MRHRTVRATIREKLGLSRPWNSGFNRESLNLTSANLRRRLEDQDLPSECWEFAVDDGREGEAGSSVSYSLPFVVERRELIWPVAGSSVGWGLELLSLVCSMLSG